MAEEDQDGEDRDRTEEELDSDSEASAQDSDSEASAEDSNAEGDQDAGAEDDSEAHAGANEEGRSDAEEEGKDNRIDAMGKDKYRDVIGGQYGATLRKRVLVYGSVLAIIIVIVVVSLTVVRNYDGRDIALKDTAPWTEAGATQAKPRDTDFPPNGPTKTIKRGKIIKNFDSGSLGK